MNRASGNARRDIAVHQWQRSAGVDLILRTPGFLRVFSSQRLSSKGFDFRDVDLGHTPGLGRVELLDALEHAAVTTRLEQIGSHGDRADTAIKDVFDVVQAGTTGIGNRQITIKFARENRCNVDRQWEQSTTGHVELATRQNTFSVNRAQGIGQFDTEAEFLFFGHSTQAVQHLLGAI